MLWPKKNSYKEFDRENNSCGSKIPPPPPINFSDDLSLSLACRRKPSRIGIKGCPPGGVCEDDLSVNQALRREEYSQNN